MGRPRGAGAETRRLTRSGYEKESNDENGTYLDGAVSDVDLFSSCGWVRREAGLSNSSAGSVDLQWTPPTLPPGRAPWNLQSRLASPQPLCWLLWSTGAGPV